MKRDIARNRMVWHSSAANKDQCGHLVTSGNPCDHGTPVPYTLTERYGDEGIRHVLEEQNDTAWYSPHKHTHFDVVFEAPVRVACYRMFAALDGRDRKPLEWRLSASNDGVTFTELDHQKHAADERRYTAPTAYTYFTPEAILPVQTDGTFTYFRLEVLDVNGDAGVALGEFDLIDTNYKSLLRRADHHFDQCWKSGGNGEESLTLDLGTTSDVEEIVLEWGTEYAAAYTLFSSPDGEEWTPCYDTECGQGGVERIPLTIAARFLKLALHRAVGACYELRRWQVMGEDDRLPPAAPWKLQRATEVAADGCDISRAAFDDTLWMPAVVPGTVLTSYMAAGAVCEYNNDQNYLQHSDAFFTADWWYRHTFTADGAKRDGRVWLNFDAINWKAEVFLNGERLGDIQGAFLRKAWDITAHVRWDAPNVLAVLVHTNDFPGQQKRVGLDFPEFVNGGATGLDEPCLAATVGWDWINTVSGRGVGIYKDVYLTYTADWQLLDPWFETETIDYTTNDATLTFRTEVKNAAAMAATGVLTCHIDGVGEFTKVITVSPSETCEITMANIEIPHARLWYPVGYGAPSLYTAHVTLTVNGMVSDEKTFRFGVRRMEYPVEGDALSILVNGRRVCCVGGNWGMDDATSRNDARDYDIKLRLHRDMHFNMIRNWVGQTNDTAFYEACDKYGVMVWDDFWLANPADGPEPFDPALFLTNAEDKVKKVRRHPSVALYCARNEGYATEPLKSALPALVARLDPHRLYLAHSAADVVSGFGPYTAMERGFYFQNTGKKLHSERGTVNIPELASVQAFLSPANRWPINDAWTAHAFIVNGAQRCGIFMEWLQKLYGAYDTLEAFVKKSQLLCYEAFKGIFEAERAADGNGMLLWMSSSVMPSFAFQTYDYYYAQNGGYVGARLANQPLFAYHDPVRGAVVLDNRSGQTARDVTVRCEVFALDGSLLWEKTERFTTLAVGQREFAPLTAGAQTVLLRTRVTVGEECYRNFAWLYMPDAANVLADLPQTKLQVEHRDGAVTVRNVGEAPAVMVALNLLNAQTGERILPTYWGDNYLFLAVGEEQTVTYETEEKHENTVCRACGYNTDTVEV